jgi:hypothetical protein
MCRHADTPFRAPVWRVVAAAAALSATCAHAASAQTPPSPSPQSITLVNIAGEPAEDRVENYLELLGLLALQAEQLKARLAQAPGEADRGPLIERLASVYSRLLERADSLDDQRHWEREAEDLLAQAEGSAAIDLRLGLARAAYARVEEAAEGYLMRVGDETQRTEALSRLVELEQTLDALAEDAGRAVRRYEQMEDQASGAAAERIGDSLATARRQRSMAHYLAGWSSYYAAELELRERERLRNADTALRHFGWLLNARPNNEPELDRLPEASLIYEHVARAALAVPAALSLMGRADEGKLWIVAIENADRLAPRAADQLFIRKVMVYGRSDDWFALEDAVADRRGAPPAGAQRTPTDLEPAEPLTVAEARHLAVISAEALGGSSSNIDPEHARISALRDTAISDLAARGELGHVLDLARKLGFDRLGAGTFVSHQVRGLVMYDETRERHRQSIDAAVSPADGATAGADAMTTDEPTRSPEVAGAYRRAAEQFRLALASPDASRFPAALAQTAMLRGLALYYAGHTQDPETAGLLDAAEGFIRAADGLADTHPDRAANALWMAIRALDQQLEAVEPGEEAHALTLAQRDRIVERFLREHPGHERAAALRLRAALDESLPIEERIALLLSVPASSALYTDARRQAARLAYTAFTRGSGRERGDRGFLAARYVDIAEPLLVLDRRDASTGDADAAQRAALRARRIVEAVLAARVPDLPRAERALDVLTGLIAAGLVEESGLQSEILYRRAQIALARGDEAAARQLLDQVSESDPRFGRAARRLLYEDALRAVERAEAATGDNAASRRLEAAQRLSDVGGELARELKSIPAPERPAGALSVFVNVADALREVYDQTGDTSARDRAVPLYELVLESQPRSPRALRGFAELAENTVRREQALDAWRTLLSGLETATPEWFETKYRHARLLTLIDRERAREVLAQHAVLYPDFGPEPWGNELRGLARELGVRP